MAKILVMIQARSMTPNDGNNFVDLNYNVCYPLRDTITMAVYK
jgi:hypothetical protein